MAPKTAAPPKQPTIEDLTAQAKSEVRKSIEKNIQTNLGDEPGLYSACRAADVDPLVALEIVKQRIPVYKAWEASQRAEQFKKQASEKQAERAQLVAEKTGITQRHTKKMNEELAPINEKLEAVDQAIDGLRQSAESLTRSAEHVTKSSIDPGYRDEIDKLKVAERAKGEQITQLPQVSSVAIEQGTLNADEKQTLAKREQYAAERKGIQERLEKLQNEALRWDSFTI